MEDKKLSVFEKVSEHEKDINEHRERIETLEEFTLALKESDRKHDERIKQLEDNALKLENTVLATSRDTQNTMKEQTEKLFGIVEKAMGYQTDVAVHKHEQKMAKINTWANVFLKIMLGLTGASGIGYLIVQHFIEKVGGN